MTQQELLNDFLSLPEGEQRLVSDFIAFLKQRKQPGMSEGPAAPVGIAGDPFLGMWKDRQDLADSSDWVRQVRRSEW